MGQLGLWHRHPGALTIPTDSTSLSRRPISVLAFLHPLHTPNACSYLPLRRGLRAFGWSFLIFFRLDLHDDDKRWQRQRKQHSRHQKTLCFGSVGRTARQPTSGSQHSYGLQGGLFFDLTATFCWRLVPETSNGLAAEMRSLNLRTCNHPADSQNSRISAWQFFRISGRHGASESGCGRGDIFQIILALHTTVWENSSSASF